MSNRGGIRPRQKIAEANKTRDWRISNLKYIRDLSMNSFLSEREYKLLELASGRLSHTDYTYITNPYGSKNPKMQRWPAKLKNYDFISPLFKRLITEWNQRWQEPIVFTKNSNFDNEQNQFELELVTQALQQRFINNLIESGIFDPNQVDAEGQAVEPPMSPEVIKQQKSSLKDLTTIQGQHAINYIVDHQELQRKYRKAWEYFVKLGRCFSYKNVLRDSVLVENVSPVNVQYWGNRNVEFLEDTEIMKVRYGFTFNEVMEIFQDLFESDEYKEEYGDISLELEQRQGNVPNGFAMFNQTFLNQRGIDYNPNIVDNSIIYVDHVQWTGYRKVHKVYDEFNDTIIEVTEDYKGNDIIETTWNPVEYEGYIIDNKYFIGGYPCDIQRVDPDDPFSTKKSYNGKIFMKGEVEQVSITEILANYQEAYNAVKYKTQFILNKNKDKIATIPLGLLTGGLTDTGSSGKEYYNGDVDDEGNPISKQLRGQETNNAALVEQALYMADSTQLLFIDETSDQAVAALQAIKTIDLSLGNYIGDLMNYAATIKAEAEELVGFNRFRTANTKASDPVTNVQQGTYVGSMVTEPYFIEFEEFLSRDLQGILDLSKHAFKVGFKKNYVRNNTDIALLEIMPDFPNAVYGVFVRSSAATAELREILKARTNELLQNGYANAASTIAKVTVGHKNYVEIIQELEDKERELEERQLAKEQADREALIEAERIKAEEKAKDRELEIYKAELKAQTDMFNNLSIGMSFAAGRGDNEGYAKLQSEANKIMLDIQNTQLKFKEIESKEKMNSQNNATKKYVADKQLAVARENKP